jgi:hypothetical protein
MLILPFLKILHEEVGSPVDLFMEIVDEVEKTGKYGCGGKI